MSSSSLAVAPEVEEDWEGWGESNDQRSKIGSLPVNEACPQDIQFPTSNEIKPNKWMSSKTQLPKCSNTYTALGV